MTASPPAAFSPSKIIQLFIAGVRPRGSAAVVDILSSGRGIPTRVDARRDRIGGWIRDAAVAPMFVLADSAMPIREAAGGVVISGGWEKKKKKQVTEDASEVQFFACSVSDPRPEEAVIRTLPGRRSGVAT